MGGSAVGREEGFDHWKHRRLFPSCESCHAGALETGQPMYPEARACASCHEGRIKVEGKPLEPVSWETPSATRLVTNFRFTHQSHRQAVTGRRGADSVVNCLECHGD